jgi:nucleoside-diphosphate-sugar epimerase
VKILMTGSTSELGHKLSKILEEQNHIVIAVGRDSYPSYNLEQAIDSSIFCGIDAIVHLAYDRSSANILRSGKVNVGGTKLFAEAAFAFGIKRFIYVSTESAGVHSKSIYGRTKYDTEITIQNIPNVVIMRVGTILGENPMGPITKILRYSNSNHKYLFVPKFWTEPKFFFVTTHIELGHGIHSALQTNGPSFVSCRYDNKPRSFHEVVVFQSKYDNNQRYIDKRLIFVPLSLSGSVCILKFFAPLNQQLSRILDSLKSL